MSQAHRQLRPYPIAPAPAAPAGAAQRSQAAPFMKWAGGKGRLLKQLLPLLPEQYGRYFEPFLGGGAVFFALRPQTAQLSDVNEDLINVWVSVRDRVDALIEDLGRHRHEKAYYYAVRARDPRLLAPVARASRMLFLNRTCFNGLYRVNRRGHFNVPFGSYTNPDLCPEDKLRAASEALRGASIRSVGYAAAVVDAQAGDFVYFDPPYDPISRTANFTSYTAGSFGDQDQRDLADTFAALDARGVKCMLSNSDTPFIRELYRHWRIETVMAPRAISRNAEGRQAVSEVVVRNY
jgi:DNA adenine methylase